MEQAIVIFTRVPEAGKTKTRMMPHLTAGQCKKLHTYFLKDIRKECEKTGADIFVCYTPNGEENETEIKAILGKEGIGQLPATIVYSYVGGMLTGGAKLFVTGLMILFALSAFVVMARKIYVESQKKKGKN